MLTKNFNLRTFKSWNIDFINQKRFKILVKQQVFHKWNFYDTNFSINGSSMVTNPP